jgi:hypothetical protein
VHERYAGSDRVTLLDVVFFCNDDAPVANVGKCLLGKDGVGLVWSS